MTRSSYKSLGVAWAGLIALAVWLFWLPGMGSAQSMPTCGDFEYQEDAQRHFDEGGGQPQEGYYGMDADGDGVACETLPSRPFYKETTGIFTMLAGSGAVVGTATFFIFRKRSADRVLPVSSTAPNTSALTNESSGTREQLVADYPTSPHSVPPAIHVHVQNTLTNSASSAAQTKAAEEKEWMTPERARSMPYKEYLRSPYWKRVKTNNIKNAGGRCTDCGSTRSILEVHHLNYDHLGEELNQFLVVLCRECHQKRHDIADHPQERQSSG